MLFCIYGANFNLSFILISNFQSLLLMKVFRKGNEVSFMLGNLTVSRCYSIGIINKSNGELWNRWCGTV